MLAEVGQRRVHVCCKAVDFRKGHNGLMALAQQAGLQLWSGDVVVFFSRCHRKCKVLVADATGVWLHYKQLSQGTFRQYLRFLQQPGYQEITSGELGLLLSGQTYRVESKPVAWKPEDTSAEGG